MDYFHWPTREQLTADNGTTLRYRCNNMLDA